MHEELRLDKQICFRLYTAARLITQAYTPMLNELGITYPQYLVLMVLWEQDSQPVNDIAHRLPADSIADCKGQGDGGTGIRHHPYRYGEGVESLPLPTGPLYQVCQ